MTKHGSMCVLGCRSGSAGRRALGTAAAARTHARTCERSGHTHSLWHTHLLAYCSENLRITSKFLDSVAASAVRGGACVVLCVVGCCVGGWRSPTRPRQTALAIGAAARQRVEPAGLGRGEAALRCTHLKPERQAAASSPAGRRPPGAATSRPSVGRRTPLSVFPVSRQLWKALQCVLWRVRRGRGGAAGGRRRPQLQQCVRHELWGRGKQKTQDTQGGCS